MILCVIPPPFPMASCPPGEVFPFFLGPSWYYASLCSRTCFQFITCEWFLVMLPLASLTSMVFYRFTLGILLPRVIPPLLRLWHFTLGVSCHRFMDYLWHKVFGVSGTLVFKLVPYDSLHYSILSKRGFIILPWYLS